MLCNQLFGFSGNININPGSRVGFPNLACLLYKISLFSKDYQKSSFNCKLGDYS